MAYIELNGVKIDRVIGNQIEHIQKLVLTKDRDKHFVIDGREGCLTGDTLIQVSRFKLSKRYPLKKLYLNHNGLGDKRWDTKQEYYIRAFNGKDIRLHKVKDVMYSGKKKVYLLELENGLSIKATSNHKFLTKDLIWTELGSLSNGIELMCDSDYSKVLPKFSKIISIKEIGEEDVYDIECEEPYHNFVANGIVVHNSGKSKLARQLAKALDPNFNIDNIAFNSEQFIHLIKDPNRKKGDCILLDEAYGSAGSRATMTEINRAMVQLGTEMRQLNLFIIFVLPTFFDLDKYFAVWRCETLIHVYFREDGSRGDYIIFPFEDKLNLYIRGKKTYNYHAWHSPYPACSFTKDDPIDEEEYRKKKLAVFRAEKEPRVESLWRDRLVKAIDFLNKLGYTAVQIGGILGLTDEIVYNLTYMARKRASKTELIFNNPKVLINNDGGQEEVLLFTEKNSDILAPISSKNNEKNFENLGEEKQNDK